MRCEGAVLMDWWVVIRENMSTDREGEDVYNVLPSRVNVSNYGLFQRGLCGRGMGIEDIGAALILGWAGAWSE